MIKRSEECGERKSCSHYNEWNEKLWAFCMLSHNMHACIIHVASES